MNSVTVLECLLSATTLTTAGLMYWFHVQIDRAVNELYTVLRDDAANDIVELQNHAQRLYSATKTEIAAAHAAATAVMTATRRSCSFCNRLVHSFLVTAGVVKCTDCKAREEDPTK